MRIQIKLSKEVYSLKAIKDTIYWFSNKYLINIDSDEFYFFVNVSDVDLNFEKEFMKSLNDFSLRKMIHDETKDIKTLVVTKAFYPDLVNFKDLGEFDDPVNMELNEAK
jgi:His-Xaa-Ser system protein HxsD